MDLQSQVQDLLDLSDHVTLLLQKQFDTLIRKRTMVKNEKEGEEVDNLSCDIALASRSLQVLKSRREIRTAIGDLMEIKQQLENYGDNPSSNWYDYIQDTMECLHMLLKNGIEVASAGISIPEQNSASYEHFNEAPLPRVVEEDIVYNNDRIHYENVSQPTLQPVQMDDSNHKIKERCVNLEVPQENLSKSNGIRRHTMDSENVSVARLLVGNLRLKQSPSKASITTSISSDQVCTNPARVPFWSAEATIDNEYDKRHSPAVNHFQDSKDFGEAQLKEEIYSLTKKYNMKHGSSIYSLPTSSDSVFEDDSFSQVSDNDDTFSDLSFVPSILSSPPSPKPSTFQIRLNRCDRPNNLFAEKVTVSNPLRIGSGIGSYVLYTCTVNGTDGLRIVVRKRYSDFVKLRSQLVKAQPKYRKIIPNLPPKKILGKFMPEFIERRRKDMEYFLNYVLLHPVLGTTPVVRWWFMD
ncbi:13583_t:CDS:2 [Funneliformis geosporum]|uniref:Endosomal/vacuolar adapter protein YPT35 n=1 Tax=Funneliformis geosporum TaxID=1117311 RepID=A0A9W4SEI7_9GLOM|nr:13583_t:CDS:2 [Funneliformis geosporum]